MSNALFLSSRWVDSALVTASSVQGLLSADHVQTFRPDQVWRATGCASETLRIDHGEATPMEAVVALAHNLGGDATIRVRRANTVADLTAAPAVDTGAVSAWPSSGKPTDPDWPSFFSLVLTEDGGSYLYTLIEFVDPANSDGYVEVGRLYAGPAFVPADNIDVNWTLSLISPGEVTHSPFGRTFTDDRGPPSRMMTIPFSALDEDELTDELYELERYCGVARDFAFCVDPAATDKFHKWAMQALFAPPQPAQAQPYFNSDGQKVWQSTLILAEVL